MKIAIVNGRLLSPANGLDKVTSLFIENDKITFIGDTLDNFRPDLTLDVKEKWVIPALVDVTWRGLEPEVATKRGFTSPYKIGSLTLNNQEIMNDYEALKANGVQALVVPSSLQNIFFLKHCYQYAASLSLPVIVQPMEMPLMQGVAHQGIVASRLGLPSIASDAETIAIAKHLILAEETGIHLHFTCLSTSKGVEQIRQAKNKGLLVSADVAMHSLHLTENDIADFDANCHVIPPLRHESDREALLEGVADKTLDAISTDHLPLETFTKLAPFAQTSPGMSTLDTFLSLGIHLVNQNQLSLEVLIHAITYGPAKSLNLASGTLREGALADLLIVDPQKYWQIEKESLLSFGKNTPFLGWELPGVIHQVLLKGQPIYA